MKSWYCGPICIALLHGALSLTSAWAAPRLPLEAFAARPLVQRPTLSPDGQKVAMLVNNQGTTTIVVQDIGAANGKRTSLMSTDNIESAFRWFRWVSDDRLLISTIFPSKRTQNSNSTAGGIRTYDTRLLSAKSDGSQITNLLKPTTFKGYWLPQIQDRVIDFEPDSGKHVLLSLSVPQDSLQGPSSGWDPAVYSVDVETGARYHVHSSREKFRSWMVDRNHQVRLGVRVDKADVEIHACDPDGRNWRKLWSYKALSKEEVSPLGFGKDPNVLYILADHGGRDALFTVDLRDPSLKRTLKLSHERADLDGTLVYSRKTKDVVGLRGSDEVDGADSRYWDKDRRELVSFVDQALPGRFNHLFSMSDDENRYLVYSSNGQTPGQIFLGDDRANKLELFALSYPGLSQKDMATKAKVSIKARDGLELPAYLTIPQGVEAKKLPMVMLVHGGPQHHDDADFDTWAQFLANRGYAVLQVNYRGSTGFGRGLMAAGLKRWGMEMQDDLTDAAQWAIANGTADPKRLCIVGASFGGYSALMGVAKTPELYQCAVSFAGVSDLVELGRDHREFGGAEGVYDIQVGSVDKDADRLRQTSPRYLASQIKVPVLLIHGTEDRSVLFEQGQYMDEALTAAGKPHRFVKQERGDHHLSLYEHGLQFFKELEGFLAQHLGAGAAPVASIK